MNKEAEMKKKILCIDDSDISIKLLEYTLKEEGFEPIAAFSVNEALHVLETCAPDLILIDLLMPEISGYEFLYMRTQLALENTPIIVISANVTPESLRRTKELGAIDFITKPVRPNDIIKKIRNHLCN